jgi:hypothetical protein
MDSHLVIAERATLDGANELIALYGEDAAAEATERAERCRDTGNVIRFCRWREVARLILLLDQPGAVGTVH